MRRDTGGSDRNAVGGSSGDGGGGSRTGIKVANGGRSSAASAAPAPARPALASNAHVHMHCLANVSQVAVMVPSGRRMAAHHVGSWCSGHWFADIAAVFGAAVDVGVACTTELLSVSLTTAPAVVGGALVEPFGGTGARVVTLSADTDSGLHVLLRA